MNDSPERSKRYSGSFLTIPLLFALTAALFCGNAERLHARLLQLGEQLFTGYFALQTDPPPPRDCATLFSDQSAKAGGEEDELEGLFDEDEGTKQPSGDEDLEDLFGEEENQQEVQAAQAQAKKRAREQCEAEAVAYRDITSRITPSVRVFRTVEKGVSTFIAWVVEHFKHFLVIILLLGTLIASVRDEHISLRPARSSLSHKSRGLAQAASFGALFWSSYTYRSLLSLPEEKSLNMLWLIGLGLLVIWHIYDLFRQKGDQELDTPASLGEMLLSLPLFSLMGLGAGSYFFTAGHPAGLAIEMTKLTEHAMLYVNVALYVWVGMLLKQSSLTRLVFNLVRPLRLEPALLSAVVVVGAAIPTAYSGASGIFVIAAGALIYEELRAAGARRQLALAATAMSGSLGVVLSPCLLVVIIASLNKRVTTDELYGWGVAVFALSALLFSIVALYHRDKSVPMLGVPLREAVPQIKTALGKLISPVLTAAVVLVAYWLILDTTVDEHSAPMVLPVLLIILLWREKQGSVSNPQHDQEQTEANGQTSSLRGRLGSATDEAGPHIGALLSLMGFSICLGGVIERAEVMALFPASFSSIWLAMATLVVILILIGMSMDPYGAVILVNATIAKVAYQSGISPVHFWMVVLVAFELGYLSPPVALNHLLTRQVVGEDELEHAAQDTAGLSFYQRHERIVLPLIVMGIALVIVAFTPLFFY